MTKYLPTAAALWWRQSAVCFSNPQFAPATIPANWKLFSSPWFWFFVCILRIGTWQDFSISHSMHYPRKPNTGQWILTSHENYSIKLRSTTSASDFCNFCVVVLKISLLFPIRKRRSLKEEALRISIARKTIWVSVANEGKNSCLTLCLCMLPLNAFFKNHSKHESVHDSNLLTSKLFLLKSLSEDARDCVEHFRFYKKCFLTLFWIRRDWKRKEIQVIESKFRSKMSFMQNLWTFTAQ